MKIWKKAFTLIELMIVVVILWVLMSTVLPKLTWAQARSRDAWRIADLWNIAAALQVYYDDNWHYPSETDWDDDTTWYCLSWSWVWVSWEISWYMQSQKVPVDPQPTANQYLCDSTDDDDTWIWRYYYAPLTKSWLNRNAYILCSDMETLQKANTDASDVSDTAATWWTNSVVNYDDTAAWTTANWTYEDLLSVIWSTEMDSEPDNNASQSVYCILRP